MRKYPVTTTANNATTSTTCSSRCSSLLLRILILLCFTAEITYAGSSGSSAAAAAAIRPWQTKRATDALVLGVGVSASVRGGGLFLYTTTDATTSNELAQKKETTKKHPRRSFLLGPLFKSTTTSAPKQKQQNNTTNHNNKDAHTSTYRYTYDPLRMYLRCIGIVFLWATTGTLFYSYCNHWPLPQAFFYAIDAGMSIGFCVAQIQETKLISKAFTVGHILLGASVVGGALALFIQDAVEGLATAPAVEEYRVMLERSVFEKADLDRSGVLRQEQFQALIQNNFDNLLSPTDIQQLWTKFDRLEDGVIHLEEFVGTFRGIHRIVQSMQEAKQQQSTRPAFFFFFPRTIWLKLKSTLQYWWQLEHRIYFVCIMWMILGISWGMIRQKWDIITAIHFAVSALATGGLTAPQVNAQGVLSPEPAIFCGMYCLLGIPLFALTLGHFARVLVAEHIAAMERRALERPITQEEYELAAHLTTPKDNLVHLSDFIVLQLLRQGKLSFDAIRALKQNFDVLDTDQSGVLSLEQATSPPPLPSSTSPSE